MRSRRWVLGALLVTGVVLAVRVEREWERFRSPKLGPLSAMPAASQLTVRVGDTIHFAAEAKGAVGFTWLVWGRPVAFAPSWSFTAAPEHAGWQQVSLEVTGRGGARTTRTWNVGVVAPTVPEIDALEPAAGPLALPAGERATFRARAHVRGARPNDRLVFEWMMDDRPIFRDEQPAEEAASELALPAPDAGAHRLRLRVTEDGHTASLADWGLDVAPAPTVVANLPPEAPPDVGGGVTEPPGVGGGVTDLPGPPAPPPSVEPAAVAPALLPAPPPPPPAPHLVRAPGPRRIETAPGTTIVLEAQVEPSDAAVAYQWTVDGEPLAGTSGRLEYVPDRPGRRRVMLAVASGKKTIGTDAWVIDVRPAPLTEHATVTPALRLVRVPPARQIAGELGRAVVVEAHVEPAGARVAYRWSVDGRPVPAEPGGRLAWEPGRAGRHTIAVTVDGDEGVVGRESWLVAVSVPEAPAPPTAVPVVREGPGPAVGSAATLVEADVRRWLDEYARAWSRKDVDALRRMGQVRSGAEAAQLERYFRSVDALEVDVRVLNLSVAGERASVEFERTDTVTDPSGRRQQLRLPPIRKEIERTPNGLRFTVRAGAG